MVASVTANAMGQLTDNLAQYGRCRVFGKDFRPLFPYYFRYHWYSFRYSFLS